MKIATQSNRGSAVRTGWIIFLVALTVGVAAGLSLAQWHRNILVRHKPYAQCGAGYYARIVGSLNSWREGLAYGKQSGGSVTFECERYRTRWLRTRTMSPECPILTSRRGGETDNGHDICAAANPAPTNIGPTAGGCKKDSLFRYRRVRRGRDYCEKVEITYENGPITIIK